MEWNIMEPAMLSSQFKGKEFWGQGLSLFLSLLCLPRHCFYMNRIIWWQPASQLLQLSTLDILPFSRWYVGLYNLEMSPLLKMSIEESTFGFKQYPWSNMSRILRSTRKPPPPGLVSKYYLSMMPRPKRGSHNGNFPSSQRIHIFLGGCHFQTYSTTFI